jgi:hypothetical protein
MTTDLEHRLREALHEDAAHARLVNPDGPAEPVAHLAIVESDGRRLSTWLFVAALVALFALLTATVVREADQSVDSRPPAGDPGSVAELKLTATTWEIVDSSSGPISGAPMQFLLATMHWDNGCTVVHSSFQFDRAAGALVLRDPTLGEGCGPPTTFGMTPHYPVVDAVMSAGPVPMSLIDGRLYLGDHPDGDFLVLERVGVDGGAPPARQLPAPGEQPPDREAAEEEVRAAFLEILDTSGSVEERAPLSERPEVWAAAARSVSAGPNWELIQGFDWEVHEVVFVTPEHAAVQFGYTSEDSSMEDTFIGDALLVDGRWVVAIQTSCALFDAAGHPCE